MNNVSQILDEIAEHYHILKDKQRAITFSSAARNIEQLDLLDLSKLEVKFIGKGIKKEIEEILQTGSNKRLEDLRTRISLELFNIVPQLYDISKKEMEEVVEKYNCKTIDDLYKNSLFVEALSKMDFGLDYTPTQLKNDETLLGDLFAQTSYGEGLQTTEQLISQLIKRGYRHGFVANHFIDEKHKTNQKQEIKKCEDEYKIRIWNGQVVDIFDENFGLEGFEYYILQASKNKGKFNKLVTILPKIKDKSVILDLFDYFVCEDFNPVVLSEICNKNNLIVGLGPRDYIELSYLLNFLKQCNFNKVGLFSRARKSSELGQISLALELAEKLSYSKKQIINYKPHPFKDNVEIRSAINFEAFEQKVKEIWNHDFKSKE